MPLHRWRGCTLTEGVQRRARRGETLNRMCSWLLQRVKVVATEWRGGRAPRRTPLIRRAQHQCHRNGRSRKVVTTLNHLEKNRRLVQRNPHQIAHLRHRHALIGVGGERELSAVNELLRRWRQSDFQFQIEPTNCNPMSNSYMLLPTPQTHRSGRPAA